MVRRERYNAKCNNAFGAQTLNELLGGSLYRLLDAMGKSKIKIQKIEKESNRRVTFNKRRIGLLKKAYEISILCDVDIALIFFSQNGELTCFEGPRSSAEEVVMKFANTSEHERAKSHIKKYTTIEDEVQNNMPKKIEKEQMFQEVAKKLFQSHPRSTSLPSSDRSMEMDLFQRARIQDITKEMKDVQRTLGLYDLNLPIEALISSSKDAVQMEFYVQKQLHKLQAFKQLPQLICSQQPPVSWLDSQKDNRKPHGLDSNHISQEFDSSCLDTNTHGFGWDAYSDMAVFDNGVCGDQSHSTILPELAESTSDFFPSSIEDGIHAPDFLEDISAHDSLLCQMPCISAGFPPTSLRTC